MTHIYESYRIVHRCVLLFRSCDSIVLTYLTAPSRTSITSTSSKTEGFASNSCFSNYRTETETYCVVIDILAAVAHEASEEVDHTDAAPSEKDIDQSELSDFLFKPSRSNALVQMPPQNAPFLYNLD